MIFERLKAAIETIVRVHPGLIRGISTSIRSDHTDARRHSLSVLIPDTQLQPGNVSHVVTFRSINASSGAADNILDPERSISALVADISNSVAIRREARLGPIKLTKS